MEKCEYCTENSDGYYTPLDKNAHVCIFDTPHKKYIHINWFGHKMDIDIKFCPICGRDLTKKDRREYLKKKAKEWYRKNKNPEPKEYKHKTEEERKEYFRKKQKEYYKNHKEKVKQKRKERYKTEFIELLKNNKQELIDGQICYHITPKTANKIINTHSIIGYKGKLYVTFGERY